MCFAWSVILFSLACCLNKILRSEIIKWESLHIVSQLFDYSLIFTYIFWSSLPFVLVLHLYLLENDGGFILKKLLNSHASLILFWDSFRTAWYFFGYKISPNMMGIQEGCNKNFHIKCIEYYEKFDSLWLFWDMRMVILESC